MPRHTIMQGFACSRSTLLDFLWNLLQFCQTYVASIAICSVSALCISDSYDSLFGLLKGSVEALLLNFSCRLAELYNVGLCMFQPPAALKRCHNTPYCSNCNCNSSLPFCTSCMQLWPHRTREGKASFDIYH
jgi:hypothetical protein